MANAKSNRSLYGLSKQVSETTSQKRSQIRKAKPDGVPSAELIDTLIVIPPDGGWGWIVVATAFFSNFIADGTIYTFGVFLEEISISIGYTKTQVALANSVMTGFYFLSGPFIGGLINSYGYRVIAVTGGLLAAASVTVTSFCSSLYAIIFVYGVAGGVGFGMMYLSSTIVVGFYFERWRALAQSISVCGSSLAIILFPQIFTVLLKHYDWRMKFRILSVIVFACAICCLLYRPLHPIRVLAVDDKRVSFVPDMGSFISVYTEDGSGIRATLSRYHNTGYPTTADIHYRSTITLTEPRRLSSVSVFVSASGPSTSISKVSSVKSKVSSISRSRASAERLRTVYEEEEYTEGKCQRCCRGFKKFCVGCCCCYRRERRITAARPLYRDDIFFSGSILALPEYVRSIHSAQMSKQTSQERSLIDYHLSVTRIATQKDIYEDFERCVCCPEAMKRSLATMLDFSILKSPSFLLLSLSGLFTTLGLFTPFLFVADKAKLKGMDRRLSYQLISTLGISNTLGRILSGALSSIPNVKALLISYISLAICGLSTLASSISYSPEWQFGFAAVFGLTVACVAALRPVIVVDMLGLEKLTNAFGITLVFQGIACLSGIPLSGYFRNITGSYELSFYFAGVVIFLSAIMLMPIKRISNWEKRREAEREVQQGVQIRINNPK